MEQTLIIFKPSAIGRALVGKVLSRFEQKGLIVTGMNLTGRTNGRQAAPGTIRGDFSMSNQENIIHASSSPEDAQAEIKRFFKDDEIFDYTPATIKFINSDLELP